MFVAALAVVLLGMTAAAAPAKKGTLKCGPKNRWCVAILERHGRLFFEVFDFDHQGKYQLCVTPPKARERCKTFKLIANGTGANASSIRFTNNFPHQRHGRYKVRWVIDGSQLGPTLTFSA
jgi:hypothetical protein